ncbi:MAG: VacJ family lipoprotein [Alphaproteobacteria bacterium]|jgi:phospholipid-binding lipoprotein MlaA|nr:VacJ family lipoprotein [Alphaproteobacteria bacterium]MDP7222244.1 VacJ family lipoprotein [Alphaproteobacteria bacterium]
MTIQNNFKKYVLTAIACVGLSACATSGDVQTGEVYDPFERVNRATFAFNDTLDKAIAEPVAKGYRAVVPEPGRKGVRNFLRNLKSPVNFANQLLQGDIEGAAGDLTRAMVNTVFGVGGLIDIADAAGIPYEEEDFGQTLGVWGVDSGPYLVLPFMGPSSVRDASASLLDTYADPLRLYLYNVDEEQWHYARTAAGAVAKREELLDVLNDLRMNSYDYYAAIRSSYTQRRNALIHDEDYENYSAPAIPDYDD